MVFRTPSIAPSSVRYNALCCVSVYTWLMLVYDDTIELKRALRFRYRIEPLSVATVCF